MFSHVSNILNAFLQFHFPAFIVFYPLLLRVWQTDFTQYIISHLVSLPYRRITITAISQNLSHHSQYQFHKKLGGLQRISGHAAQEKNLVAPVWYQSSQSTTHNLTPQTKVHKQSQSHPVHNFMHCISNHLYCLTVRKLWWWSVLFTAYDQNYAFIISSLLQVMRIPNRGWTIF